MPIIKMLIVQLVWIVAVLGGVWGDRSPEFVPFDDWKRQKVKNATLLRDVAVAAAVNDDNRFNYASIDCAAKVLKTNEGAKESKSVLKEDKDSYLINKCLFSEQFIVIELCQDILIDLIEMGNFELFSSNFRNFRVSVNERYDDQNWKVLGEFEGSNSRELQKFRVLNPLVWAKFLKVEILDHYGSEFYCPISLIKVYGKTMLEDFKEDSIVVEDLEYDECKVEPTVPYLGLNEFLNSIPDYCAVNDDTNSTATSNPQDSIFKNIIKRLSLLESNASLSLLYIEEQSKLLSDSFTQLQLQQQHDLDRLIWHFNLTFNDHVLKLNQYTQLKLKEDSRIIEAMSNDLSFYKRLVIVNFILLVVIVSFLVVAKDVSLEGPGVKSRPFRVGSTKKKYKRKMKFKF